MNDIAFKVIIKNDGIDDVIFKTIMLKGEKGDKGDAGGVEIDDSTTSATKTWSSQKIKTELDALSNMISKTGTIEDVAIASFSDGADDVPVSELIVDITAVQAGSGAPSPDNIRDFLGFDNGIIKRCGKNLCDWKVNTTSNPLTIKLPKGTYTISYDSDTTFGYWYFRFIDKFGNVVTSNPSQFGLNNYNYSQGSQYFYGGNNLKSITFILPDEYTVRIGTLSGNGTVYALLEVGDTATTFETYNGNTYEFAFGQTVYGGYFDNKGNLIVTNGYKLYDGSENWIYQAPNTFRLAIPSGAKPATIPKNCNMFTPSLSGADNTIYFGSANIVITSAYFNGDVNAFKSFLSTNNLKIGYELANSIVLPITSQDMATLLGNNNIFANTGKINKLVYFKTGSEAVARMIEAYMRASN